MRERPVVVVSGPTPPPVGGVATVIRTIFESAVAERFELVRFSTNHPAAPRRGAIGRAANAARARVLGLDAAWNLDARDLLRRFDAALAAVRPDLVHLHSWHGWDFWISARMAQRARRRGAAALLHVHGNFDVLYDDWSRAKRAAFRRALVAPDRLIVLSHSWREWFARHLDASRIEVVRNAVDAERFAGIGAAPHEGVRLLFAGVRDPELKGAYDLLAIAGDVVRAAPAARFVLAGEDVESLEERLVRGSPLAARVEFAGAVAADAMPALFARCDALLLPSHREALPMVLLEAMAAGLPVVASDLHAIREALPADVGNALVRPGDRAELARQVAALVCDAGARVRAGAANRARIEAAYDLRHFESAVEAVYRRALHARSTA